MPEKTYHAQVYNFFGALKQSYAQIDKYNAQPSHIYSFFYDEAIDDLRTATTLCPHWYQPYEWLGETYLLRALDVQGDSVEEQRTSLLRRSLLAYNDALSRVHLHVPHVREPINQATATRRVQIGQATALLLMNCQTEAHDVVAEVTRPTVWDPASELDYLLLYNLAGWYSLSIALDLTSADTQRNEQEGRRCLAYSLGHCSDPSLSGWAGVDPVLRAIRGAPEEWASFVYAVQKERQKIANQQLADQSAAAPRAALMQRVPIWPRRPRVTNLSALDASAFRTAMENVLRAVQFKERGEAHQ